MSRNDDSAPGGPEEPQRRVQPERSAVGAQDGQRRNHRDEDAYEELGDLGDGCPLEVVARAIVFRGRDPGQGGGKRMRAIWTTYSTPMCTPKTLKPKGHPRLGVNKRLELRDEAVEDDTRDDEQEEE